MCPAVLPIHHSGHIQQPIAQPGRTHWTILGHIDVQCFAVAANKSGGMIDTASIGHPCTLCAENHGGNIRGGAQMTLPPGARRRQIVDSAIVTSGNGCATYGPVASSAQEQRHRTLEHARGSGMKRMLCAVAHSTGATETKIVEGWPKLRDLAQHFD